MTMSQQRHLRLLCLLALAGLAGCATTSAKKTVVTPPPPAPVVAPPPAPKPRPVLSLREIVARYLQHGRYADGEQALQDLLAAHPEDRAAKAMLHQLIVNPEREMGAHSRSYVVQPGDSYSTLAARYLGSAQRFLILARYNHADDPSRLRVGQTLRLPLAHGEAAPAEAAPAKAPAETDVAKADRLQQAAATLLAQGHKDKALVQMDSALSLDPHLKPSSAPLAALRQQLIGAYHQHAIVLYRDQKLDAAIALWDHVLAIDPGYEPATVYRARALELKQRLKQF